MTSPLTHRSGREPLLDRPAPDRRQTLHRIPAGDAGDEG